MVDFDSIVDMELLHSFYVLVYCRSRIVRFYFLNEQILGWRGRSLDSMGRFLLYLKARKMISKGYLYTLVQDMDFFSETLTYESFPVVNEFLEVFQQYLFGIPPKMEIDFVLDFLLDT